MLKNKIFEEVFSIKNNISMTALCRTANPIVKSTLLLHMVRNLFHPQSFHPPFYGLNILLVFFESHFLYVNSCIDISIMFCSTLRTNPFSIREF